MKKEEELQSGRFIRSGHFHPGLRKELIREIESGVPRSVIVYQYGVSRAAISKWMRCYGSQEYKSKQLGKALTDAEKSSIIRQVEQGALTPYAARQTYGLSGSKLNKWLKESLKENAEIAVYDPFEMNNKLPVQRELQDTETEALKKALEEAQLKITALNTLIDVAEDQFKIKIRKKAGARQSK